MGPKQPIIILTFLPEEKAKEIAGNIVKDFQAAAVNISTDPISSFYRWLGKFETATEVALCITTTLEHYDEIAKIIKSHHPYDLPAIMGLPIIRASNDYREWIITNSTGPNLAAPPF